MQAKRHHLLCAIIAMLLPIWYYTRIPEQKASTAKPTPFDVKTEPVVTAAEVKAKPVSAVTKVKIEPEAASTERKTEPVVTRQLRQEEPEYRTVLGILNIGM